MEEEAETLGITRGTLQRAKIRAKVKAEKDRTSRTAGWMWSLTPERLARFSATDENQEETSKAETEEPALFTF